jgi:anti-sigma B factor antagonist
MSLSDTFPITRESTSDSHRIAPAGELDIATVPLLDAAFDEVASDDGLRIILDLTAISFIDSTGIQLLLKLCERCNGSERLTIVPSAPIERLLDITGLRDQLPLSAPTPDRA